MNKPTVSVVCTNYNKGDWIAEAIESFLRQKVDFEYEILVIDDASTDHSPDIIREYAKKYPQTIRAFFNKKNLGITKTWTKVCKEAKGKYIARCDGDDYWIDDKKLQMQVSLLEKSKDSLWCSTDYNIITPEGKLTHTSAFETGQVDRSDSYAEMLATKGFTMSSTWLIGTDLMREINENIDSSAVDDTFNIQLDLFNKTKLTYIPKATVVYRLSDGSDSRPIEIEKIRSRNERLLQTQLEYIEKYKDIGYGEILKILLRRNMQTEMWAIERLQIINEQRQHIKRQEAYINQQENTIRDITSSRSYLFAIRATQTSRSLMRLPGRVKNRLLRLQGNYRYKKYLSKKLPTSQQLRHEQELAKEFPYQPLISVIVPTYNTPKQFFAEMIDSVKCQTYSNWEMVLIDDASPDENIRTLIKQAASQDRRIRYKFLKSNQHIAGATNEGFHLAKGEFVTLFDHDDVLQPNALFEIVKALNENRNIDFIYTNEDKITDKNQHIQPFIKPGWNPDFLYSANYITHLATIRKKVIDKYGGEDGAFNGAQDWELFLRITRNIPSSHIYHIPKILYSWRVHKSSTAKELTVKPYVFDAQKAAIISDLDARNQKDYEVVLDKTYPGQWYVNFKVSQVPKVTIVIPKMHADSQSINTIKTRTNYTNYTIHIVNNTFNKREWIDQATAEYTIYVQDKITPKEVGWIEQLLSDAQREDIGFVQAQLTSQKDFIKNLSTILDSKALHLVKNIDGGNVSKHLYTTSRYNVQAIHGGIGMVKMEKLTQIPSNDMQKVTSITHLSNYLSQKGYRNLYNPYVKVLK